MRKNVGQILIIEHLTGCLQRILQNCQGNQEQEKSEKLLQARDV
jgi:hypothetical protein